MNKIYGICLILVGFFFQNPAFATDLVQFPTGPATWTIEITPSKLSFSATPISMPHLVKIVITQDGQKRRSQISSSTGATIEQWSVSKENVTLAEEPNGHIVVVKGNGGFNVFAVSFDTSSFQWLDPKFLVEKDPVSYQGQLCFHYRSNKSEAWIESKTLLPVALDDGLYLGTFTFQKTPPPPFAFPAKFQHEFDRFQN